MLTTERVQKIWGDAPEPTKVKEPLVAGDEVDHDGEELEESSYDKR